MYGGRWKGIFYFEREGFAKSMRRKRCVEKSGKEMEKIH